MLTNFTSGIIEDMKIA